MRDETGTEEDSAPAVGGRSPWTVSEVSPLPGHRLAVRFVDGTTGIVDVSRLVFGPAPGVFEPLRDAQRFAQVGIDHGAVSWPGELDLALAPDAMYDEIRATGNWTPE